MEKEQISNNNGDIESTKPDLANSTSHNINHKTHSRERINLGKMIILIILSVAAGFFGGLIGAQNKVLDVDDSSNMQKQIIASESQLINQIAKDVGPSVVSINVSSTAQTSNLFGRGGQVEQQSAGTGFIISKDGVIVTNRHVVPASTKEVSITLSDGTKFDKVEVIGRTNEDDSLDVAFLKITDRKGKNLVPAKLGDSSKVQVGDRVVAIGNALGQFQNTVTSGIISGYGRDVQATDESGQGVETLQNLFQTDTAINQGNSGGPLVNTNSEVIAINTAVAGDAENIGFAIPINDVKGLIDSVLKEGRLLRPYLGVRYISLTDDTAVRYNLNAKRGAYLAPANSGTETVISGSPADKAGLKVGDVIVQIDNTNIDEKNSLTSVLGIKSVGDKVTLKVIRDGKEVNLTTTLEEAPEN